MKKKLILIVICLIIIVGIFTRNVMLQLKNTDDIVEGDDNKQKEVSISLNGEQVTRAQMAKMMSFLFYSESDCSNLLRNITYSDIKIDDWYDEYVNAIQVLGLIDGKEKEYRPLELLTYGESKNIIESFVTVLNNKVSDSTLKLADITDELTFQFDDNKNESVILQSEWMSVYGVLLGKMKELYNTTKDDVSKEFLIQCLNVEEKKIYVVGTYKTIPNLNENTIVSQDKVYAAIGYDLNNVDDMTIDAYTSQDQIVCMKAINTEEITLNNIYIESNENKKITAFVNGYERTFYAENELAKSVQKVIGDLVIKDKKVIKVMIKPDTLSSKVLTTTKEYVELEKYGKVYFDENYKIYKLYGELSMEETNSILVGYDNADFVLSGGKICAVLINELINAKNIRVLIKTEGYKDIFHNEIKFKVDTDFTLINGKSKKSFKAGKTITIKKDSKYLSSGRLNIKTKDDNSKITILSISRSGGHPQYRGSMEITLYDQGLTLINELPLEEYLYAVVPSEMPTNYGTEALKVQAICARSYAYNQLLNNSRSDYGAHVDDSSTYQVYNNFPESKESILAVKDTYGKVLEYNNSIVLAYYFSTSCGYTTSARDVWGTSGELKYLAGSLQNEKKEDLDLSKEDKFRQFILVDEVDTYDKEFPWYRWHITINADDLKKTIDRTLQSRYNANPNLIKTLVTSGDESKYESIPIDTVGEVKKIQVADRGTGGIITELIIVGSKNTVKIMTEFNIRTILAPLYDTIIRQDGTKVSNLSMMPSAFFVVDSTTENGTVSFTFHGGGYGHGVGMSQNGVKAMTDVGKTYDEILSFYYAGTQIANIYN